MRQYVKTINGETQFYSDPLVMGDRQIFNPTPEQLKEAGWQEYNPPAAPSEEYQPTYQEKVVDLIRERYSIDDEIALLRQRETKLEEYQAWYDYCEQCKAQAKQGTSNGQ